MIKKISILLVVFALIAAPAFAASPWTTKASWGEKATGKLGYGLKNLLLGVTEIFTEPYEAGKEGGNILTGIGKGLWNGVADIVGGALHVVTFPITCVDVPLPEGGVDLM